MEKRARQARHASPAPERSRYRRDGRDAEPQSRTRRGPPVLDGDRVGLAFPALPALHHHRAFRDRTARADRLARARLVRIRAGRRDAEDADRRRDALRHLRNEQWGRGWQSGYFAVTDEQWRRPRYPRSDRSPL